MERNPFFRMTAHLMVPVMSILLLFSGIGPVKGQAAGDLVVNLAPLDGVGLTPENIFSYSVQSNIVTPTKATVKGTVRYRQSSLSFSYSYQTTLHQGLNQMNVAGTQAQWTFSAAALGELFRDYHMLPQGTYEYCVTVTPLSSSGEMQTGGEAMECLYKTADDIFLINLTEPENDAKLYEHYPVFSWIVNYPFASQLTYRIRVAEIKDGQNTANAVARNNPVYAENNLPQTTTTYPVYAKPLITFQPYAWTVDAYFKGILLGGAEPWKFTIIEDSELVYVLKDQAYYEFEKHKGDARLHAIGKLKLKYVTEQQYDTLSVTLFDAEGKDLHWPDKLYALKLGDNRVVIPLMEKANLGHKKNYTLKLNTKTGIEFELRFKYVNPLFID